MNIPKSPSVYFSVLGPVRAWHAGRELHLGSPQQRVVLAAMLLRRGHPVSRAELVDAVWGARPPASSVSVLRTYVSRLRKVLEPGREPAGRPCTIVSVGDGYQVRIPEEALDLAVFERRVADAARASAAGDEHTTAQLLREALEGWRGVALAGLPGRLAEAERSRLTEQRLNALEARLELDVRSGQEGQVVGELLSLTGEHPLRESVCRLLMLALYQSGRQAESLAAYRRTRGILATELGVEPGAALRDLHARILAAGVGPPTAPPPHSRPHDSSTTPAPTTASPAAATDASPALVPPSPRSAAVATRLDAPAPVGHHLRSTTDQPTPASHRPPRSAIPLTPRLAQLPADLTSFTGRHVELERTRMLLPLDRSTPDTMMISTIGGMAGIGKTTLAVHLAHQIADRFPDGQLCVNLRGFDPAGSAMLPAEAVRTLLDALGVPSQRLPAGLEAQTALYRSVLAERRVLILLDNARDSEQVRPLLPGSPGCLVIVTSRNQLTGLVANEGAHPLTLSQPTPAEAHEFLVRRLGAERLAREPGAVAEIMERCALLPLALAVVAARAATHPEFPLDAIAKELRDSHDSLDAFAGDDITIDVRTVFSSSYEALSQSAARLFRLLSLHSGPDISTPAVAALAGLPRQRIRGPLMELAQAHLVTEHFPGRYTLHDLLRVYAAERVQAEETASDRDAAVERLPSWYLHTADAAYAQITPHRHRIGLEPAPADCQPLSFTTYDEAVEWCETERPNLVSAVHQAAETGQSGIAWRLPAVLWGFFYLRSHHSDWYDTARTGLAAARRAHDRPGEAQALMDTGAALRLAGHHEEAVDHYQRAMTIFWELGDTQGKQQAVNNLGEAYLYGGQPAKAVEFFRRGLALHQAVGNVWAEGIGLGNLGDAYHRLGLFDDAMRYLEQALTVTRACGNRWVEGVSLDVLGTVCHRMDAHDRAFGYFAEALATHRDIGNRWGEGETLCHLGDLQLASGDREAASESWRQALAIFAEFDHPDAAKIEEKLNSAQLAAR
ncbi:tetratricopeptide repeat protein (plasmid) [Streptomyces sp. NBC_01462]